MKDIKEVLRDRVVTTFNEYKDYVELMNEQNKARREELEKIKELYKENEDDQQVQDFTFQIFMVDAFHKRDVEILGTKFVNYVSLYREIPEVEPLDEEIESSYEFLYEQLKDKQAFIVDTKGKFAEIRKGYVEEKRKIFEEKDMFHKLQTELEKYL
jgi:hypothetical protein